MTQFIFWAPAICAALHIFEEFAWPGGFAAWFRVYRPETAVSFTPTFAVLVNAFLLFVAFVAGWFGPMWDRGLSLLLILSAVLAFNGLFHLVGAIRTRRYSPGMVTGLLLYLPMCVIIYWHFLRTGTITAMDAAISLGLGTFFQVWSFTTHRRRATRVA